ncbi:hypothetical protein CB1_000445014 [Camelus ferus]|nr:hypothetical protein CB1_000445014 [Camelus ferus]
MKRMETVTRSRSLTSFAELIHGLECRLLNASFGGHNLTLQTNTIQTLAFKLGCDFTGLSLSSAALGRVPQVPEGRLLWERPGNLGSFEDPAVIPAECLGAGA